MNPPREDGMPFMLTEAQKRELRALGYTEEEILHIGHRIIAEQCQAHDWRERKAVEKKRDEDFPEDDKPKSRPEGEDATPLPEDGLDFADFAREQAEAAKSGRKPRLRIVELHGAFDLL